MSRLEHNVQHMGKDVISVAEQIIFTQLVFEAKLIPTRQGQ